MGSQGKGNPNKNFIFNHLDSNYMTLKNRYVIAEIQE